MKIKKISVFCLLLIRPLFGGFDTLSDLKEYAQLYSEYQKSDNNDWVDPEYTSFYKNVLKQSVFSRVFKRIKSFFGFKITPEWDPQQFAKLLEDLKKNRLAGGPQGLFDQEIERKEGDRFIVWGDLHGAFHSLVRDLNELMRRGIINENLVIQASDVEFVFIGDLVNRSPYSLETLQVVLLLMSRNPKKVFYLRGTHERKGHWEGFGMRRDLKLRLGHLRSSVFEPVPLVDKINLFYSVLPDALIISHQGSKEKMGIMHSLPDENEVIDKNLKLLLHGEQRLGVVQETNGLKFIGYSGHIAQWSLLSCPTEVYQRFFKLYHDSFVEVSLGASISESVLTLYNHDLRGTREEFSQAHFNPIFGYTLREKRNFIKDKTILNIGSTVSLTGIVGPLGQDTKLGIEAALYDFNKEDNKVLIKPVFFDDGYEPRNARNNIKRLQNVYGIDIILVPTGTPPLAFYLDMVRSGKISVLFPYTGGIQFRKPNLGSMTHFRASYTKEIESALAYLTEDLGIKKIAFFYQDDDYGAPIAQAAHEYLRKQGISTWLDLPHFRAKSDFRGQIAQLKKFAPEAIGCFSSHFPTTELISQLGTEYFLGRVLFGTSFLYSDMFKAFLEERGIPFVFSAVMPIPRESKLEIVGEYEKSMNNFGQYASIDSLEGYLGASLLIDAVKHIPLPITKEKVVAYIQSLNNYSFKGLTLTFDPETRQLFNKVWVRTLDGKWLER
ncbi:ABC transporter substrate-binding protein [Candidatus Dependentiae bacterium]|nr:ABC transporter substrate-binding protein [Candidatus Dependentiae bacterium]